MDQRKRSCSSDEDGCESKARRQKFTEIPSLLRDNTAAKHFDEPLGTEYQPQFFDYQLVGDLVAVEIANSVDLITERPYYVPVEPIRSLRFCDETWSVHDLLLQMKSQKSLYPIAKKVILSVGYNDYRLNSMNADMFIECLEKTIKKLRRRGCAEIMVTNVPPCGLECDSLNHWKYLQIINEEIHKVCDKHEYIGHCDIFRLFCRPKNLFSPNKEYVTCSEINYKVDFTMYNEVQPPDYEIDLISFSDVAKMVLGKHVAKSVEKRLEYLRRGQVDKVICVLKEASDVDSDSEDEVMMLEKKEDPVINLDSDDELGTENKVPRENGSLKKEILTAKPSYEKPPEEPKVQVILCSIDERNLEMLGAEDRTKEVISGSIKSERQDEEPYQVLSENERPNRVISCSIRSVKPSCEMPQKNEEIKQEIVGNDEESEPVSQEITSNVVKSEPVNQESVSNIKESEPVKQEIVSSIEESEPVNQESVSNIEESEPVKQEVVSSIEESEPLNQETVSNIEESEPVKQEIVGNVEESEPVNQEIASNAVKSEPTNQEIVSNIEKLGIEDQERLCEIPTKDGRFVQVIRCNFKNLVPEIGKLSCEVPQENSLPAESPKVDLPFKSVILCSIQRVDVEREKL